MFDDIDEVDNVQNDEKEDKSLASTMRESLLSRDPSSVFAKFLPKNSKGFPDYEEALELIKKAQQGDVKAKQEMIERNLLLAVKEVTKFAKQRNLLYGDSGVLEDLMQEAVFGLDRAVMGFDTTQPWRFSTYAVSWIYQCMSRGFDDTMRNTVRIPTHLQLSISRINRAVNQICRDEGTTLNNIKNKYEKIAIFFYQNYGFVNGNKPKELPDKEYFRDEKTGLYSWEKLSKKHKQRHIDKVTEIYNDCAYGSNLGDVSLDATMKSDDDNGKEDSLIDFYTYDSIEDPDHTAELTSSQKNLSYAVAAIKKDVYRQVIRRRIILGETLDHVGQTLGLTRERIRQIQVLGENQMKFVLTSENKPRFRLTNPEVFFDESFEDNEFACRVECIQHTEQVVSSPKKIQKTKKSSEDINQSNEEINTEIGLSIKSEPKNLEESYIVETKVETIKELLGTPTFLVPPAHASKSITERHFRHIRSDKKWPEFKKQLIQEIDDVIDANPTYNHKAIHPKVTKQLLKLLLVEGKTQQEAMAELSVRQDTACRYMKRWRLYKGAETFVPTRDHTQPFNTPQGYKYMVVTEETHNKLDLQFAKVSKAAELDAKDFASKNPELIHNLSNLSRNKCDGQFMSPFHEAIVALRLEGVSSPRIAALAGLYVSYVQQITAKYNKLVDQGKIDKPRVGKKK